MIFTSKEFTNVKQFHETYRDLKLSIGEHFGIKGTNFRLLYGSLTLLQKYEGKFLPATCGSLKDIKEWVSNRSGKTFKIRTKNIVKWKR